MHKVSRVVVVLIMLREFEVMFKVKKLLVEIIKNCKLGSEIYIQV